MPELVRAFAPARTGHHWTTAEIDRMRLLIEAGYTPRQVAVDLGRTVDAVMSRAIKEGLSLRPSTAAFANRRQFRV